jgi:hypothetical protein
MHLHFIYNFEGDRQIGKTMYFPASFPVKELEAVNRVLLRHESKILLNHRGHKVHRDIIASLLHFFVSLAIFVLFFREHDPQRR